MQFEVAHGSPERGGVFTTVSGLVEKLSDNPAAG